MKLKRKIMIFIILGAIIIAGAFLLGQSYALFNTSQISKSAITIKVGTINPTLGVDLLLKAGESDTFTITLENKEEVSGKFLLYYQGSLPSGVTFGYLEEEGMDIPLKEGIVLAKGEKKTFLLYVDNQSGANVSIDLQAIGGLSNQNITLPSGGNYIEKTETKISYKNQFISSVYQYDQKKGSSTFCVTGEESTCVQIKEPSTYEAGTIIKYKVNDTLEVYFHVMFDNGTTLTLQQRENTLYRVAWSRNSKRSDGPITVLPLLESATTSWKNVLDQTYTLGTTSFYMNANTGCPSIYNSSSSVISCTANTYTLPQRTAKARMITVQEAQKLGCVGSKDDSTMRSCPVWMYNYLADSTSYGGTVNVGNNDVETERNGGYWTNNSLTELDYAWFISPAGNISNIFNSWAFYGARAVIVVNK